MMFDYYTDILLFYARTDIIMWLQMLMLDWFVMTEVLRVIADVNTTATLDQMASGDTRVAPVRKAKWHLGEHLLV